MSELSLESARDQYLWKRGSFRHTEISEQFSTKSHERVKEKLQKNVLLWVENYQLLLIHLKNHSILIGP